MLRIPPLYPVFVIPSDLRWMMRGQAGFWDLGERYQWLSAVGDPLEKLNSIIPWAVFEKPLAKALKRSGGSKGGRLPFPAVLMKASNYR